MKKVLTSILILITILTCYITVVNAASSQDLIDYASKTFTINGKKMAIPTEYINALKSYVKEYPLSEEDADKIISKANSAIALMNEEGVSDPTELSEEKKNELYSIASDIASIANVTFNYNPSEKTISIYKNGKLYCDPIYLENPKFAQTGNNYMIYVIGLSVAVIAIAITLGYRKLKENA